MPYRPLGNTGMHVSALGLGTSPLRGGSASEVADSIALVRESVKMGINYIASAPWYGHGVSEELLGQALKQVPRESYYLGTKVGRYEASVTEMFDFSFDRTVRSVDQSLERTGLDYVDLMQVHDPEFCPDIEIVLNETLPALQQAKDEGKIRHIGVTGYPLAMQKELIERSEVQLSSSLVYCHYSLHDTTLIESGFLDFLEQNELGCINASPLAMGLLTHAGPPVWHPALRQDNHIIRGAVAAAKYCEAQGVDMAKLAVHFTLRQPRLTTTLVGAQTPDQMERNIAVLGSELSELEETVLQHVLSEFFAGRAEEEGWVGVEPAAYWSKLGKELECARRYPTPVSYTHLTLPTKRIV
eukprot:TRINITY_DN35440_c0_g1_i1.p1 TRINITY_DN35440_c0_g1~~TRINITY_DN35440_c0_g1_i1.p1  ORF type:complete len:356 (-),score=84.27 TRINITY_DN35440_c0_g1_i1:75-1142(-)